MTDDLEFLDTVFRIAIADIYKWGWNNGAAEGHYVHPRFKPDIEMEVIKLREAVLAWSERRERDGPVMAQLRAGLEAANAGNNGTRVDNLTHDERRARRAERREDEAPAADRGSER